MKTFGRVRAFVRKIVRICVREGWWAAHNCVAHPLLTLTFNSATANRFHDWTSEKAAAG